VEDELGEEGLYQKTLYDYNKEAFIGLTHISLSKAYLNTDDKYNDIKEVVLQLKRKKEQPLECKWW
jgi:hypothetical protein